MRKKLSRSRVLKKKLNLKDIPDSSNKFLIIQIDALSYTLLKKHKEKYMPFLNKYLKSNNLEKYSSGYPSNTSFTQAGILYGENFNIPSFRFLDKKTKTKISLGRAQSANFIEDEIIKKNTHGILRGGTSISNSFSGSADRCIFTSSHLYKTKGGPKKLKDLLFIIFLNPTSTFRVLFFSLVEFFAEVLQSIKEIFISLIKNKHFNWPFTYPYFPFTRTVVNAILREISTKTTLLEMDRNVPFIYINYLGYDLISHYRGPESLSSLEVLKHLDFEIKKLVKKSKEKKYDIYILSDHGQIPSVPFLKLYNETLEDFLKKATNLSTKAFTLNDSERSSRSEFIYKKLKYIYRDLSLPLRALTWALIEVLKFIFRKQEKKDPIVDWSKKEQLMVFNASSLSHIYFNYTDNRMELDEIEQKHPFLIPRIVNHPGIGFIIIKNKSNFEVISDTGKVIISPKSVEYIGENFLERYSKDKNLIDQIRNFASLKHSGDIIINGNFNGKKIIAFEDFHFGSHDSIGGKQSEAFFISKEKIRLDNILDARPLYKIFKRYHNKKLYKSDK